MMNRDNLCYTDDAFNEEQKVTGISPYVYTANMEKGLPQGDNIGERVFLSDPVHSNPDNTSQREIDS